MVTPSFCVIKLSYLGNYCGMAENYHGKMVYTLTNGGKRKRYSNLPLNFYNIGS